MQKKYEFIKNGADDYTLKYKDKEINFSSNVEIQNDLQGVTERARKKMILELAQNGVSIKDLTKEIKKDGKTYYDNSNKDELEKVYIQEEQAMAWLEIVNKLFNTSFEDLIKDIGITTEKEVQEFGTDIGYILAGQFPSGETKQESK